uniref:TFIIF beta subunit N-terminal domain-containing protein n=1 Tax=Oryza meridionalis TaxID=40149 RepID=A0A0E0C8B1_9ORYZ
MAEEAKNLETARADRSVWLMKCPTVVSRAWQEAATAAASSSSSSDAAAGANSNSNANPNPVVAKVIVSLDPLRSEDQQLQFKMEMAQTGNGNTPKSYSLNMFKDFVPMCVFSESNQEGEEATTSKTIRHEKNEKGSQGTGKYLIQAF